MAYVGPLTHASGAYLAPWFWKGARNLILAQPTPQQLADADADLVDELLAADVVGAYELHGLATASRGSGEWPVLVLHS